jgi:hypothetical protein
MTTDVLTRKESPMIVEPTSNGLLRAGVVASIELRVRHAVRPVTWSVLEPERPSEEAEDRPIAGLPPGLALSGDGHLGGVPTTAGRYEFEIQAVDSRTDSRVAHDAPSAWNRQTAVHTFTLTVV